MCVCLCVQCSEPFELCGTEVVKLTVEGASFVLNQIRKMVGTLPYSFVAAVYSVYAYMCPILLVH